MKPKSVEKIEVVLTMNIFQDLYSIRDLEILLNAFNEVNENFCFIAIKSINKK